MSLDRAVPSSPGTPSIMGRRRTKHFDLPPRMQRKGSAYYYVCGSPSRQWVPLGTDLAKAKRRWAELDAGAPQSLSVGDLVQKYLDREDRAPGTQQMYRSYHRAIADAFPIPAAQLTSQHVALWRELQAHRKVYANGCITLLTSACRLGKELGLSDTITVGKWATEGRDRVLEPGEFRAIRDHAVEWLQVAMDLGYLTGARPSDLRALRWADVNTERVAMRQIKTAQRMEFTMTDDLASVLDRARRRSILGLFVIASPKGRPVSRDMMSAAWISARIAAGIPDAQFRDIRAMAAKASKEGGQDFQALLGHTTRAMSERYIKGRQTVVAEPVRRKL
jgi:integrase